MLWLEWWNFMFLLPFVGGLVLGLGLVASGAMADVSDLDSGDLAAGEEAQADSEASETGENAVSQILSFFGLGQGVPLSVMLPLLLMSAGLSGLIFNAIFSPLIKRPVVFAFLSLILSFVVTAFLGQGSASLMSQLFKAKKSAIQSADLIGLTGRAVYVISESSGVAHVKDPFGNIHRISCRLVTGTKGAHAGEPISIKDYDSATGAYLVELIQLEKGNV